MKLMKHEFFIASLIALFVCNGVFDCSVAADSRVPRQFAPGNFFSAAAADKAVNAGADNGPAVARRPAPSDFISKELVDSNPTIEQLRLIPSLSASQLKQLNMLFNIYRTDMKTLREELKALRLDFKSKMQSRLQNESIKEADDQAILTLLNRFKERREKMTADIAAIVSGSQLLELEAIKRGKVPAYAE